MNETDKNNQMAIRTILFVLPVILLLTIVGLNSRHLLKVILAVLGVLLGIYSFYKGFNKIRECGFKFSWRAGFENISMADTPSGNFILYGILCFLAALFFMH